MSISKLKMGGLSVVEFLVVVFILSLIGVSIFSFAREIFSISGILSSGLSAEQDARSVVRVIASELRAAATSATGSYALGAVSAADFTFYSDVDGDSVAEEIRYYLDGSILKKALRKASGAPLSYSGSPSVTNLIVDVKNGATAVFDYYDTNYDGTSPPLSSPVNITAVRLIKITVMVERDPYRAPTPIIVSTQVSLRNLKDNL